MKLSEKGLVQKIVKFKSQQLKAYPLSILQTYIDQEKIRVGQLQSKLASLEESLSQVETSPDATEVRYYHGARGLQQMVWNTTRTKEEIIGYSQFGLIDVISERFTQKIELELIRKKIHSRVITNPEYVDAWRLPVEPVATYRRTLEECRTLPRNKLYIAGDTTIYNNVFATVYWKHGEVVGVEIENPKMVKTQRSMFELLWEQGTPQNWSKTDIKG
jgi:hypothetical protein